MNKVGSGGRGGRRRLLLFAILLTGFFTRVITLVCWLLLEKRNDFDVTTRCDDLDREVPFKI
jgi:hypothetical protein